MHFSKEAGNLNLAILKVKKMILWKSLAGNDGFGCPLAVKTGSLRKTLKGDMIRRKGER